MKRAFLCFSLCFILLFCATTSAKALTIDASAAILIDATTGRIIFQQNDHEALAPASTTKIVTALLVLENVTDLSTTVTLPDDFVNVGESSIYLEPGETQTYEDLLYALLLRSANDAAQALAIGVAGSEEAFVEMMNQRSEELGLTDSHWDNPHGLDAETHLTSAYDLAMIAKEAMKIDTFNTIIATKEHTMPWEGNDYDRVVYNHNQFLDLYEGADGVKTGYTSLAGSCLVASATRDGLRLIGVVLNATDHYTEMARLMDYGFCNYEAVDLGKAGDIVGQVKVISGRVDSVNVILGADVSVPVEINSGYEPVVAYDYPLALEAPFTNEESIGDMVYEDSLGNTFYVPLYLDSGVERYSFTTVFAEVWQAFLAAFL